MGDQEEAGQKKEISGSRKAEEQFIFFFFFFGAGEVEIKHLRSEEEICSEKLCLILVVGDEVAHRPQVRVP
ncbi:hypothetical protein KSP40_PGU013502 [Platanthera guangdongensis]|uniref:Uncharacterized protein n=1 Tax=Platanthera guangdongensis TaxID=2320717 RepID=A0ABR2LXH4_9ASPA